MRIVGMEVAGLFRDGGAFLEMGMNGLLGANWGACLWF